MSDVLSRIVYGTACDVAIVRELCRARPSGFQYMKRYRSGHWDGYISLMHGLTSFPSGLLDYVLDGLKSHNVIPMVEYGGYDIICRWLLNDDVLHGVILRDYQMHAISELLRCGRGVAKMATNAGKTEVMAAMLKLLSAKALVVVHRKELMYQTVDRFRDRLGSTADIGMIGDGVYQPADITVAMIQTLASRDELVHEFSNNVVLMVDECHHVSSNQMMDVLHNIPGPYRYGFSGTPLKYDALADMKLIGVTGPVVVDVTNADLIENGYSAKPQVILHTVDGDEYWDAEYHDAYRKCIISNEQRNDMIAGVANDAVNDSLVLILVSMIEHGFILRNMIPGSVFVHGSDSMEYRHSVLDAMRSPGSVGVYIASPIFDEGIDVPGVDVVILAAGGKSRIKLLQRIGRGLRAKDGRNVVTVYDFIDDTNKYLLSHSESRIDTYAKEGFETVLA